MDSKRRDGSRPINRVHSPRRTTWRFAIPSQGPRPCRDTPASLGIHYARRHISGRALKATFPSFGAPVQPTKSPQPQPSHPLPNNTMRWLNLLTASLLPFTALAAKKPTGDRFNDARAKSLSIGHPLKLDDASYAQLTKSPRDYGVAILLTALEPRFGCMLCRDFQPEWDLLGKSWMKGDKNGATRLVFGTLDFVDGKNVFQSVR